MERAKRVYLVSGEKYRLNGQSEALYLCLHRVIDHPYSVYCAYLKNIKSGWTFYAEGTNMYSDGSIDWDWSKGGHFEKESV